MPKMETVTQITDPKSGESIDTSSPILEKTEVEKLTAIVDKFSQFENPQPVEAETPKPEKVPEEKPEADSEKEGETLESGLSGEAKPDEDATDPETPQVEDTVSKTKHDRALSKMEKRINTLVWEREQARSELTEEKARKSAVPETAPETAKQTNPYVECWDEQTLDSEYEEARNVKRWARENSEGAVVKQTDGSERDYTADEVKSILYRAEDALEKWLPARMRFLGNYSKVSVEATEAYPFWKDAESDDYKMATQVLGNIPGLKDFPDFQLIVGDFLRGRKARMNGSNGNGTPATPEIKKAKAILPQTKTAPAQPAAPTAAPTRTENPDAYQTARAKYYSTRSDGDLKNLMAHF